MITLACVSYDAGYRRAGLEPSQRVAKDFKWPVRTRGAARQGSVVTDIMIFTNIFFSYCYLLPVLHITVELNYIEISTLVAL